MMIISNTFQSRHLNILSDQPRISCSTTRLHLVKIKRVSVLLAAAEIGTSRETLSSTLHPGQAQERKKKKNEGIFFFP